MPENISDSAILKPAAGTTEGITEVRRQGALLKTGALQNAIFNSATFYNADGKRQGVFAAARDVTKRKRLDQVPRDKNTGLESVKFVAEKAHHAKSDFRSSKRHEWRTPLNAIVGIAQMVRLQQIIKAGWYLLELINQIRDLAVIESGKLSLSREPVSLTDVMRECHAMIEPQAQKRGIRIIYRPFDSPWFAHADRTRVKYVLTNLLSNAIKYNREHGTVEVKCTVLAISANALPHDIGKGLEVGFFRYLTKPIKVNTFLVALGSAPEVVKTDVGGAAMMPEFF